MMPRATVHTLVSSLNSISKISPVFKLFDWLDVRDTVNSPSPSSAVAIGVRPKTPAGSASFKFPVSDSEALKQLGNSVAVTAIQDYATAIVETLGKRHGAKRSA